MTEIKDKQLTPEEIAEREAYGSPEAVYDREYAEVERQRRASYQQEADPLFFKWQAGEATQEEWLAKRAEIAERYPYPEKVE